VLCGENRCKNSYGTYTCIEPTTIEAPTTTTTATTTTTTTDEVPPDEVEEHDEDERTSDVEAVEDFERSEATEGEDGDDERSKESETEIENFDRREDVGNSLETSQEENETHFEVPESLKAASEATTCPIESSSNKIPVRSRVKSSPVKILMKTKSAPTSRRSNRIINLQLSNQMSALSAMMDCD
jgi:hypothetical protein